MKMNAIARHPSLFLLLQADLRVPSAFLRKGAGQDMMPAGFLIFGPFLVLVAGALRLVIGSLSDPSSFWIWTKTDYRASSLGSGTPLPFFRLVV